jgi:hypothetical protein
MSLDLFETRRMLAALEQRKPPRSFLLDTFFSGSETFDTEHVDIDIWKGKRRLAPFVNPRKEGKVVESQVYKTRSYKPPYIKPKKVTTAEDILKREMGQHIYGSNMSQMQKAAQRLGKDLAELDDMILRREEWMAAQVLTTGKVRCQGDGIDETIDFLMEAEHLPVLAGAALWSATTTAKPLQNMRDWKRLIAKDSGVNPTDVIMSPDVYDAMLYTDEVKGTNNLFDNRRIMLGQIEPRDVGGGVTYIGRITELGLDLWTYEEWYVDEFDDETEKSMIPTGKLIMGSPNAYTRRLYGAIKDLKSTGAVRRFPKSWEVEDPSARFVMVQSAPIPALHQVDAFLCATVK